MVDTSNQLKKIRKERKLTIQAVCDGTGIAIRTYQNYEYGKREISAEALSKLADFYGVTTDYLLGRSDEKPDAVEMLTSEEFEQELLREYFSLPDKVRAEIREMMKQAVERSEKRKRGITISGNSEKAIARSSNNTYINPPTPEQEAAAEDITDDESF